MSTERLYLLDIKGGGSFDQIEMSLEFFSLAAESPNCPTRLG